MSGSWGTPDSWTGKIPGARSVQRPVRGPRPIQPLRGMSPGLKGAPSGGLGGYGGVAFSPGGGGIGPRRPGVAFNSPVNSGVRMTPKAMVNAQASAQASIKSWRSSTGRPILSQGNSAGQALTEAAARGKRNPIISAMKNKKGLAIGLGAAVIGGLAYSGKRGEGSSGGRAGMTRY